MSLPGYRVKQSFVKFDKVRGKMEKYIERRIAAHRNEIKQQDAENIKILSAVITLVAMFGYVFLETISLLSQR
jgi:hypothetical protein